jgi:hypothetical protein
MELPFGRGLLRGNPKEMEKIIKNIQKEYKKIDKYIGKL